jgi:hypothetical protein
MALCPFAEHKLIPPGSNDPAIRPRMAILHIAVTDAWSLFDFFKFRSGGIESHFYITWRGKIEQYRDTEFEADANYRANPFAISIETQGWAGGKWNRAQRRAIKRLLLWLHEEHGIPLRKPGKWYGSGVGYHSQFPEWSPVAKSCPGAARIAQYIDWLLPWMAEQVSPVAKFRKAVAPLLEAAVKATPAERTAAHRMYEGMLAYLAEGPRK